MKRLLTLIIAVAALPILGQVTVQEKNVNIDGSKNGFEISIPYGTQDQIEKALKDEMKSWKGNFKGGKFNFVDDGKLKILGDNTFDAYGKVEANSDGGGIVLVAIDLGGAYLSSGEHGAQFKAMEVKLQAFGVKAAKGVVDDEIKEEEKILKEKEKDLEDLEKDQEKAEKEIEDYKKKIEDNEKAIDESKKAQEEKKSEITEQEEKVKTVTKKKEAVK